MAEIDAGGFGTWLTELYESVEAEVEALIAAAAAAIGGAIGSAIGTAGGPIGAIIGAIIGGIIGAIMAAIGDDVFSPMQVVAELPSQSSTFSGSTSSPIETLTFSGFGGRYRVNYNWQLDGR